MPDETLIATKNIVFKLIYYTKLHNIITNVYY